MTFYDLVVREASALLESERTERSAHVLAELDEVRHAVAATARALENGLASLSADTARSGERDGSQVVERLAAASTRCAEARVQAAKAEAEEQAATVIDTLRAELQQATDRTNQLTAAFTDEKQGLIASFRDQQQALADSIAEATRTADVVKVERDAHKVRLEEFQTEVDHLTVQLTAQTSEREAKEAELAHVTAQLAAATARSAIMEADLADVRDRLEANSGERAKLVAELQTARIEIAAGDVPPLPTATLDAAETTADVEAVAPLERLLAVFQQVSDTRTIGETSICVANGLVGEWSRVALFEVRDTRLERTHAVGFESLPDGSTRMIPLALHSLFADTMNSNRVRMMAAWERGDNLEPLDEEPALMMTLPLRVNGRLLAMIYADRIGQPSAGRALVSQWEASAELLRCHAVGRLEHLMNEPDSVKELRAFAQFLLDEVAFTYGAALTGDKPALELQRELQEALGRARQMYRRRAAVEGPEVASLFEEELADVVIWRPATPFGRDLTALLFPESSPNTPLPLEAVSSSECLV